ncbi:MAG: hypothetical protein WA324_29985 [Bryobacteraceae bacterium]
MLKSILLLLISGSLAPIFAASCTTGTIQTYASEFGNSLTNCSSPDGILLYNNFSDSGIPGSATLTLSPNSSDGFDFTFDQVGTSTPYQATSNTTFTIIYEFTIDPAPILGGSTLRIDPPTGDDSISQSFCVDSNPTDGFAACLQNANVISTQTVTVVSDNDQDASASITLNPQAQSFGWVETTFSLGPNANGEPGSFDSVSALPDVIITSQPEPMSLGLLGCGLLALAGAKLKKRSR